MNRFISVLFFCLFTINPLYANDVDFSDDSFLDREIYTSSSENDTQYDSKLLLGAFIGATVFVFGAYTCAYGVYNCIERSNQERINDGNTLAYDGDSDSDCDSVYETETRHSA